jgi:hypothetical protein
VCRATFSGIGPVGNQNLVNVGHSIGSGVGRVLLTVRRMVSRAASPVLCAMIGGPSRAGGPHSLGVCRSICRVVSLLVEGHRGLHMDSPLAGLCPTKGHEKAATQLPTRSLYTRGRAAFG